MLMTKDLRSLLRWGCLLTTLALSTMTTVAQAPAIRVDSNGDVGFGTSNPDDGDNLADRFIEVMSASSARLVVDSGDGPGIFGEFMFQRDNSNTWSFGNEYLQFYIYNYDRSAYDLRINRATGDVTLGGTCADGNGGGGGADGCDGVFDSTYELPSIEKHAAEMWAKKHLPAVGPTPDGKKISFSVQERHFAVLNELEKAHIYIEQLNDRLNEKDQQIVELNERLAHLEFARDASATKLRERPE